MKKKKKIWEGRKKKASNSWEKTGMQQEVKIRKKKKQIDISKERDSGWDVLVFVTKLVL